MLFLLPNQQQFTDGSQSLPGLQHLTYCQRLARMQLESLELQRLRFDLIFTYKLVFGLIDLNLSDFRLCSDDRKRGHQYKLFLPGCSLSARHNFFTYRAAKMWNDLLYDSTDFSSLNSFKRLSHIKNFS